MNEQVRCLFHELADLPAYERESILAARNVTPELRAEVESLLASDAQDEGAIADCIRGAAAAAVRTDETVLPQSCGPYTLVRLLGSGGMGSVYLAERADGEIQQQVAIKMLRPGADKPTWQHRFLRERQLLAYLSHPAVARLLDAGRTADGHPYLVMEYVNGVPIDVAAQTKTLREQLALFLQVCDGVAHAHRHLIIHRDLKPSNILVDASGQPKLLDFGIAKLLAGSADQTQPLEILLTPNYASPEQLRGEIQTTATDIYSLGAVLYKLLAGRSPHQSDTGASRALEIIAGTAQIVPARRLRPAVPADIDAILQKALRQEPEARYASVEAFAADIRAFLDMRPVQARSAGASYRARKFLRRHWIPITAAALVLVSLSVGLYVANRERTLAQRRFRDVRQLSNKLFDIDRTVSQLTGATKARQMIVDTSLEYLRRLATDVHGDWDLALEVGNAYKSVAEVEGVTVGPNLGQLDFAERDLATAEQLVTSVIRAQPSNRLALLRAAEISADRMAVAWSGGRYDRALPFAQNAAGWLEKFNAGTADKALAPEILQTYGNVAHHYMIAEHLEEALRLSSSGSQLGVALGIPRARAAFLDTMALSKRYMGDLEGALATSRESVAAIEALPSGYNRDIVLSMSLARQGWILGGGDTDIHLGRPAEAVPLLQRAFDIADNLVHKDPNDEAARSRLHMAGGPLAAVLSDSDPRRALAVYDHTYRDMTQVNSRLLQIREAGLLAGSTYPLRSLGHRAEARQRLDRAFALLKELNLYPADKIEASSEADWTLCALADYEAEGGNVTRAIQIYDGLLDRLRAGSAKPDTSLQDAVNLSRVWTSLADLHRRQRHPDLAASFDARREELWRQWDRKLPNNSFVLRQIARKIVH